MKQYLLTFLLAICTFSVSAQSSSEEIELVKRVINQLFDGMRRGDSSMVAETFSKGMILQSVSETAVGANIRTEKAEAFLKAIGTPHAEIWDEQITFDHVLMDGNLASVWTSYKFYIGEKFSHCGVNSFQMVKGAAGWKIVYLIDTRRKDKCNQAKS